MVLTIACVFPCTLYFVLYVQGSQNGCFNIDIVSKFLFHGLPMIRNAWLSARLANISFDKKVPTVFPPLFTQNFNQIRSTCRSSLLCLPISKYFTTEPFPTPSFSKFYTIASNCVNVCTVWEETPDLASEKTIRKSIIRE